VYFLARLRAQFLSSWPVAGGGGGSPTPPAPPDVLSKVQISTLNGPADGFILDSTARVSISGDAASLKKSIIRLNGEDVTGKFSLDGTTYQANLEPLNEGANQLVVMDGSNKLGQRTIIRGISLASECSDLLGLAISSSQINLPTTGAQVTSAKTVAAVLEQSVSGGTVTLPQPEYCQVNGVINPVDTSAPPINFQVNLPVKWNEKIAQLGGSGFNGSIPGALIGNGARFGPESLPPQAPYAITRGFVVYGSDSGHQSGNTWPLNKESLANYGYMQVKKTHDVAVAIVEAAYKRHPRKSYHFGTSTGGREALQAAQRYPDDYDGILSQVPVIAWPELNTFQSIKFSQAQLGSGWIPPAKISLIDAEVRRQCDAIDGLEDGYIANSFACDKLFDPLSVANPYAAIRCPGGDDAGDTCLSDAQISTLNLIHSPNKYSFDLGNGVDSFPGWQVGSESTSNSPYPRTQPNISAANAPNAFLTAVTGTTTFNSLTFQPTDYVGGVQYLSSTIYATNPDLTRFAARGGKLVLKANTADYTAGIRIITAYYESVVKKMGKEKVDEFMRYYTVVGAGHNRNIGMNTVTKATAPYYVDFISMIDNWSEDDQVPSDSPTVTMQDGTPPFAVQTSLPMCRYPTSPYYVGGDVKSAASYQCR